MNIYSTEVLITLSVVAYILYLRAVLKSCVPNLSSWMTLGIIDFLSLIVALRIYTSYSDVIALIIVDAVLGIAVLTTFWRHGKFSAVTKSEYYILAISLTAFIISRFEMGTPLVLALILCLAKICYFPTFYGVLIKRNKEPMLPWGLWSLTTLLILFSIYYRPHTQVEFIVPTLNFIVHLSVFIATIYMYNPLVKVYEE